MQTPRFESYPTTINSAAYHCLGLTDYVELEQAARRMRAQALAAALARGFRSIGTRFNAVAHALFGQTPGIDPAMGFRAEELRALGFRQNHIRAALVGQVLGNAIGGIIQRIAAALKQSVAESELYALDDRTLQDMGLTRSTIPAAVAGELYRPGAPSNENGGEGRVQVLKTQAGAAA